MTVRILVLAALSLAFFSCQKSEKDTLYEAQACLNEAPAEQARACVSELASMSSPEAYRLRCAAEFNAEGFRKASDFIEAMDKLKDDGADCPSGTCSGTFSAMSALVFNQGDTKNNQTARDYNLAVANTAFELCTKSNSKGYTQISSLFKLGTTTTMQAYKTGIVSDTPSASEIEQALNDLISDPQATETVGEIAMVAYQSVCEGAVEPSESTVKYCEELNTALVQGNNNPAKIGECLMMKIADKDAVCPP